MSGHFYRGSIETMSEQAPQQRQPTAHRRGSTVRLGRLAGIPIGIQPLWLVVLGLLTYLLGHDYFPQEDKTLSDSAAYALGLISALLLFGGILLHELGHAVVARRRGVAVDEIDLWLLGGVSRIHGEPETPGDELRFAIAGPAVTAVIAAVAGIVRLALGSAGPDWLRALVDYQLYVGVAILVFNLLPAFPLDGGRVLRSLLWMRLGDREAATERAAAGGRAFGILLIVLGILSFAGGALGGAWLAIIGAFLLMAASAEEQSTRTRGLLAGRTVADIMVADPECLRAELTLDEAIVVGFAHHLYTAFPVVADDDRPVGLLEIGTVRAVPAAQRASVRVAQAMATDPELFVPPSLPAAELLARPSFARHGRAVVVDGGRVRGLVSVTDLQRRLRADELLTAPLRRVA
jgi:Zn-dependent protease/CBS domain-containing protein